MSSFAGGIVLLGGWIVRLLSAVCLCAYLLLDSEGAILRAREAMILWTEAVAPAMFPFLVLLPVFTDEENRRAYEFLFGKIMKRVFLLPESSAACAVIGMIAGTPAGAIAVRRGMRNESLTQKQACTCLHLSTGVSPVFMISAVGQGMFSDAWTGVRIAVSVWTAHWTSAAVFARLPLFEKAVHAGSNAKAESAGAVRDGVLSVLTVCGWMVAFSVFLGALPKPIYAIFEVSTGAKHFASLENPHLASALCAFGGFCVIFQSLSVCGIVDVSKCAFIALRLFSGALAFGISHLIGRVKVSSFPLNMDAFSVSALLAAILALLLFAFLVGNTIKNKGNKQYGKA